MRHGYKNGGCGGIGNNRQVKPHSAEARDYDRAVSFRSLAAANVKALVLVGSAPSGLKIDGGLKPPQLSALLS